jgi:light-regulated signal transduction histidine kinase (bacteriophytochrome)
MSVGLDELRARHLAALQAYLRRHDEAALSAAYDLGRLAVAEGWGILDVAGLHQEALRTCVAAVSEPARQAMTAAGQQFLGELLSPFEMAYRGYREANDKLQRLNDDLRQQKDAVMHVNKELEAFSYSISHDLRAPLRSMDGFSQILLEDHADRLDDEGKGYLRNIRAAAQRMARLIEDILELAKVTRGELVMKPVDLSELARVVVARLSAAAPRRRVDVVIHEHIIGMGDPRLLGVVLDNLLGNAWKFTSRKDAATIELGQQDVNGRAVYFVRDNGAGFDMAYAKKLFGLFQRLHASNDFEGTGIGLATVQRIIHRHGGDVWAESKPGEGTTFFFTLGSPRR